MLHPKAPTSRNTTATNQRDSPIGKAVSYALAAFLCLSTPTLLKNKMCFTDLTCGTADFCMVGIVMRIFPCLERKSRRRFFADTILGDRNKNQGTELWVRETN